LAEKDIFKTKDNMGSGLTGAKPIKFEFYEEMGEHFERHPSVTPIHIALSSTTLMMKPHEILEIY
jgi:hypothetical protein